jgi:hypothetical protein
LIQISSIKDLSTLSETFSSEVCDFFQREFAHLQDLLGHDEKAEDFRPERHGYVLFMLEPNEPDAMLERIGLAPPFLSVEFVDCMKMHLAVIYRVVLMLDNERFSIVYVQKDSQNDALESWMAEQATVREDVRR